MKKHGGLRVEVCPVYGVCEALGVAHGTGGASFGHETGRPSGTKRARVTQSERDTLGNLLEKGVLMRNARLPHTVTRRDAPSRVAAQAGFGGAGNPRNPSEPEGPRRQTAGAASEAGGLGSVHAPRITGRQCHGK